MNQIEITDFHAPELDIYARWNEVQLLNRHEPDKGIFIAESPRVIERALDAGYTPLSILTERRHLETQAGEVIRRCGEIPVYTAEFDLLSEITGFPLTRGMLCAMRRPGFLPVEQVCRGASRIAVLEHVMNPTNVGAIFRSAAALNMDAILLTPDCSDPLYRRAIRVSMTPDCSDPLYRRAIRVSMGTVFQIPWTYLDQNPLWPEKRIGLLRELGFKTAAMALRNDTVDIRDPELHKEERLAVVLGAEGDGLTDVTIESCDYTICIPMAHGVDSLNVAAASAVAFWELGKR